MDSIEKLKIILVLLETMKLQIINIGPMIGGLVLIKRVNIILGTQKAIKKDFLRSQAQSFQMIILNYNQNLE